MLSYWKELLIVLLKGASNLGRSHLLIDCFVIKLQLLKTSGQNMVQVYHAEQE